MSKHVSSPINTIPANNGPPETVTSETFSATNRKACTQDRKNHENAETGYYSSSYSKQITFYDTHSQRQVQAVRNISKR